MNALLLTPVRPWFLRVSCSHSDLTNLLWGVSNHSEYKIQMRVLRGSRMVNIQSLFDEISAALQFPYYFGYNWAALDECITDLEWMKGDAYIIAISDFNILHQELGSTTGTLLQILDNAATEWSTPISQGESWDRPARPFHVLFHAVTGAEVAMAQAFREFNYECIPLVFDSQSHALSP